MMSKPKKSEEEEDFLFLVTKPLFHRTVAVRTTGYISATVLETLV
jgi:hypothetical protein